MFRKLALVALLLNSASALAGQTYPSMTLDNATVKGTLSHSGLPGLTSNLLSTGVPGLYEGRWFIYNDQSIFDGQAVLRVDRRISSGSGNLGGTYKGIWAYEVNGSPTNAGFEWTITGQQDNYATAAAGGQNVGVQGTIFRWVPTNTVATTGASGTGSIATITFGGGAVIPVSHSVVITGMTPSGYNGVHKITASSAGSVSFPSITTGAMTVAGTIVNTSITYSAGMNGNCEDHTQEPDPVAPCLGAEFDVKGYAASTDANRQRVGVQIVGKGVAGTHIGIGLLMGTDGIAIMDRGIQFGSPTAASAFAIGLDFTGATFSTAPIVLASGQRIIFDGTTSGAYYRSLRMTTSGFTFGTQNGDVAFIDDNGNFNSSGTMNPGYVNPSAGYKINGTAGFTGTKVAGSCTFYINGGIITNVTGC